MNNNKWINKEEFDFHTKFNNVNYAMVIENITTSKTNICNWYKEKMKNIPILDINLELK